MLSKRSDESSSCESASSLPPKTRDLFPQIDPQSHAQPVHHRVHIHSYESSRLFQSDFILRILRWFGLLDKESITSVVPESQYIVYHRDVSQQLSESMTGAVGKISRVC